MNLYDELVERGLVAQSTDPDAIRSLLDKGPITLYCGFDPTASSLTIGNLVPVLMLSRFQRAGHRVIAVSGGATAMVGDPSGKTAMRPMMDADTCDQNLRAFESQLRRFLSLDGKEGRLVNNADWFSGMGWLDTLRTLGPHFSVNRMLGFETYKVRMAKGLTFLELSYQLLQAYDFLHLYREEGCLLQVGGDDQWANILAGMDLVRRMDQGSVEGLTFPLLTTASGAKMGKTEDGAIWLDPERTSAYQLYQYWINIDDRDVPQCFRIFTFLSMEEISGILGEDGAGIREAKRRLAYEVTSLVHGEAAADGAAGAAEAAFSGSVGALDDVPSTSLPSERFHDGIGIVDLLTEVGLCGSRSDARRLVSHGGAYVNGTRIEDVATLIDEKNLEDGVLLLRAGKKRYHRILVGDRS